jgi:hypothetical protein
MAAWLRKIRANRRVLHPSIWSCPGRRAGHLAGLNVRRRSVRTCVPARANPAPRACSRHAASLAARPWNRSHRVGASVAGDHLDRTRAAGRSALARVGGIRPAVISYFESLISSPNTVRHTTTQLRRYPAPSTGRLASTPRAAQLDRRDMARRDSSATERTRSRSEPLRDAQCPRLRRRLSQAGPGAVSDAATELAPDQHAWPRSTRSDSSLTDTAQLLSAPIGPRSSSTEAPEATRQRQSRASPGQSHRHDQPAR